MGEDDGGEGVGEDDGGEGEGEGDGGEGEGEITEVQVSEPGPPEAPSPPEIPSPPEGIPPIIPPSPPSFPIPPSLPPRIPPAFPPRVSLVELPPTGAATLPWASVLPFLGTSGGAIYLAERYFLRRFVLPIGPLRKRLPRFRFRFHLFSEDDLLDLLLETTQAALTEKNKR